MQQVFERILFDGKEGLFVQGSMMGNELLFQLYLGNKSLEILQFGIVNSQRRKKRGSTWLREVLNFSQCTGTRIIARNVNPELCENLCGWGFKFINSLDMAFPF
jgi:hypothetical protein